MTDKSNKPGAEQTQEQGMGPSVEAELAPAKYIGQILEDIQHSPSLISNERSLTPSRLKNITALPLWVAIKNRCAAISFPEYERFINCVLCEKQPPELSASDLALYNKVSNRIDSLPEPLLASEAYEVVKVATEIFLLLNMGAISNDIKDLIRPQMVRKTDSAGGELPAEETFDIPVESYRLEETPDNWKTWDAMRIALEGYLGQPKASYIKKILVNSFGSGWQAMAYPTPFCDGLLVKDLKDMWFLELIWSYWHEEGMLVQTLNAICRRFQNLHGQKATDPLADFDVDPLRSLSPLLWGHIQDEQHRLSVARRNYEYDHHYGLRMVGKAIPQMLSADSRSKFLEAFHYLLYRTHIYYREDSDTTVVADGFPVLNALKEVHMLLAEGAGNQFRSLPYTARTEMLLQEWLLGKPQMRDFLRGRMMVPYPESWMSRADAMKRLQGWTDTSVTHFRDLGVYGEQILLSVRYTNWMDINDQELARSWARYWKPEIQSYIHSYRAATGADLTTEPVDATMPSRLLMDRLAAQRQGRLAA